MSLDAIRTAVDAALSGGGSVDILSQAVLAHLPAGEWEQVAPTGAAVWLIVLQPGPQIAVDLARITLEAEQRRAAVWCRATLDDPQHQHAARAVGSFCHLRAHASDVSHEIAPGPGRPFVIRWRTPPPLGHHHVPCDSRHCAHGCDQCQFGRRRGEAGVCGRPEREH